MALLAMALNSNNIPARSYAGHQVGIMTERIKDLTGHLKTNKKDFAARRGLLQLVGKRRRLLKYIAEKDSQKYFDLIQKLGIRR